MCRAPEWFDFKNGKALGGRENDNSAQPGYFKHELIKKGRMQLALEYAGSEATVYSLKLVELSEDDKYLRCKGCPRHAARMSTSKT